MIPRRVAWTCLLAITLVLAACYPDLDWREVTSASGGYAVLMPAKPEHLQREVAVGGILLTMSMDSVQKEGIAFGAAYADIPAQYSRYQTLLDAARDALLRNIDGRITSEREVVVDGAAGHEFYAEGTMGKKQMRLAARVLIAGHRFYQVVCVGQSERLATADVALFLNSFRLLTK